MKFWKNLFTNLKNFYKNLGQLCKYTAVLKIISVYFQWINILKNY